MMGMLNAWSRLGSTWTWYWRTNPPSGATSATPGTDLSWYLRNQSCSDRSSASDRVPVVSTSTYWKTQPTPVASGPSSVCTPAGRRGRTPERYSSVRVRAQ